MRVISILLMLFSNVAYAEDAVVLKPLEYSLEAIDAEIANLNRQLKAADQLKDPQSNIERLHLLEKLLEQARNDFKQGHFSECSQRLLSYRQLNQRIDNKVNLEVSRMLAYSLEATGDHVRALDVYLEFIAAQERLPTDLDPQLSETIVRILSLVNDDQRLSDSEKARILASMVVMPLRGSELAQVLVRVARSGMNYVNATLLDDWLIKAIKLSQDVPETEAQALYERARLSFRNSRTPEAESRLVAIRDDEKFSTTLAREQAILSLARIYHASQRLSLAITAYRSLPDESAQYHDARYGLIFALAKSGQYREAVNEARAFIQKYQGSTSAKTVRAYLGMLEIELGDFKEAQVTIENVMGDYVALQRRIESERYSGTFFSKEMLEEFMRQDLSQAGSAPVISNIVKEQTQLVRQEEMLSATGVELNKQIFALTQRNAFDFKPEWRHRALQLQTVTMQVMLLGNKLLAIAEEFIKDQITANDRARLGLLTKDREQVLTRRAELVRRRGVWREWSELNELLTQTKGLDLSAIARIGELERGVVKTEDTVSPLAGQQATHQVLGRVERAGRFSQQQLDLRLFHDYIAQLSKQYEITESLMDRDSRPEMKLTRDDFRSTWQGWASLVKAVGQNYENLNSEIDTELNAIAEFYKNAHNEWHDLWQRQRSLRIEAEKAWLAASDRAYKEMTTKIATQLARFRKWEADLHWAKGRHLERDQQEVKERMAIDLQSISGPTASFH